MRKSGSELVAAVSRCRRTGGRSGGRRGDACIARRTAPAWMASAVALAVLAQTISAQPLCTATAPLGALTAPHAATGVALNTDPASPLWARASTTWIARDCSKSIDYPSLKTEIRAFWTATDLYLLFICPYSELNLFLPKDPSKARSHLWDRDVVEIFLGDNWTNINLYKEFEIAPTGDWIDLSIDYGHDLHDEAWRSGWLTAARIDPTSHVWYAAARIPLKSISASAVHAGTRWRMNLYRTDGLGADPQRHFMCWQPTCVPAPRDPNHVPEHFGTLTFGE